MKNKEQEYNYTPLKEPIPITKQNWPEDTVPLVATSTSTYNHEPFIRDCIEGILMQKTTFPVRVVIFEDASTDKTAEIVKEYAAKYPKLIFAFCQEENTYGKGEIRRKATAPFRAAREEAKYIALCEGDDYWTDPLKLQKQMRFLEENEEFAMCFHNAKLKYEWDRNKETLFQSLETREYTGDEILIQWTVPTASVVYRRDRYTSISNPNYLYNDIILFLSLAEKGKLWCMNEVMSVYRKHENSITKQYRREKDGLLKIIIHNEEISQNFGGKYKDIQKIKLSKYYIYYGFKLLLRLNLKGCMWIYKGFITKPSLFFNNINSLIQGKIRAVIR